MAGRLRARHSTRARRSTIRIPEPIARNGDAVDVLNYRKRPPAWEAGIVWRDPHYLLSSTEGRSAGYWSYHVRTVRTVARPGSWRDGTRYNIDLYVGPDSIRRRR